MNDMWLCAVRMVVGASLCTRVQPLRSPAPSALLRAVLAKCAFAGQRPGASGVTCRSFPVRRARAGVDAGGGITHGLLQHRAASAPGGERARDLAVEFCRERGRASESMWPERQQRRLVLVAGAHAAARVGLQVRESPAVGMRRSIARSGPTTRRGYEGILRAGGTGMSRADGHVDAEQRRAPRARRFSERSPHTGGRQCRVRTVEHRGPWCSSPPQVTKQSRAAFWASGAAFDAKAIGVTRRSRGRRRGRLVCATRRREGALQRARARFTSAGRLRGA